MCVGCMNTQHTIETVTKDSLVYVTKDSIINIHDTTTITNVIKEYEFIVDSSRTTTGEWWDNVIYEWVDTLGQSHRETHEKGNRNTVHTDYNFYTHSLEDSLAYYKYIAKEWEAAYLSLSDNMDVTYNSEKEIIKPTLWSKIKGFVFFILAIILYELIKRICSKRRTSS